MGENVLNHICPYCGEPLPEEAAFCPACAKSVNQRAALKPPDLTWRRLLHRALPVLFLLIALLLLAGAAAGYYRASQPQTYDGLGEVFYSDSEGSYHLFFPSLDGSPEPAENNPFHAVRGIHAVRGTAYRYPVPLSITDADSGTNAGESFLQKVDWFSAQFSTTSGASFNVSCTQPEARPDLFPDAALVSLVDFSTEAAFTDSMIWTFQMKNGDVIQLCQNLEVTMIPTYDYFPGEVPETSEELQDFLDEIIASVESNAEVTLYLPAVTYDGPLVIRDHPVNLYGTSAGDRRTVFTAPLRVEATGVEPHSPLPPGSARITVPFLTGKPVFTVPPGSTRWAAPLRTMRPPSTLTVPVPVPATPCTTTTCFATTAPLCCWKMSPPT